MKKNPVYIITFLILSLALSIPAYSQKSKTGLKKMSEEAEVILTGKVLKQNSLWNESKTKIYTNVTIEVNEYIKGENKDKNITVTHPGGEIGSIGEWYSHVPGFNNDEEVLLFIKKDSKNINYRVLDGEDGKMTLYTDKKTGDKTTSDKIKISVLKNEIRKYSGKK